MVILGVGMPGRKIDQHAYGSGHARVLPLSAIAVKFCPRSREMGVGDDLPNTQFGVSSTRMLSSTTGVAPILRRQREGLRQGATWC
jgi:hypothetical protein